MIKLSEPFFYGNELTYLKKCIKEKWISPGGRLTKAFEKEIKKYTTGKYNLALNNCTSALQMAVRLLNPKQSEEIIVPTVTFIATINAVIYNNCNPIFLDCDEELLLNKDDFYSFFEKQTYFHNGYTFNKITKKKILSVIIVNTFGNLFYYDDRFINTCKKKNIKIIEDAAESLGSKYIKNKKNNFIFASCYSFNGNKLVTSGGGGVISINNKKNYSKANYLSSQAKDDSINFIHNEVGYNNKISNVHAAIGLSQLMHLPKILKKKKRIHNMYKNKLDNVEGLEILSNPKNSSSNNWLNILLVKKKYGLNKNQIIKKFKKHKIETRSLWYPNHLQKPFQKFKNYKILRSTKMFKTCLCLPSSYSLKLIEQKKIINLLRYKFKKNKSC